MNFKDYKNMKSNKFYFLQKDEGDYSISDGALIKLHQFLYDKSNGLININIIDSYNDTYIKYSYKTLADLCYTYKFYTLYKFLPLYHVSYDPANVNYYRYAAHTFEKEDDVQKIYDDSPIIAFGIQLSAEKYSEINGNMLSLLDSFLAYIDPMNCSQVSNRSFITDLENKLLNYLFETINENGIKSFLLYLKLMGVSIAVDYSIIGKDFDEIYSFDFTTHHYLISNIESCIEAAFIFPITYLNEYCNDNVVIQFKYFNEKPKKEILKQIVYLKNILKKYGLYSMYQTLSNNAYNHASMPYSCIKNYIEIKVVNEIFNKNRTIHQVRDKYGIGSRKIKNILFNSDNRTKIEAKINDEPDFLNRIGCTKNDYAKLFQL